MSYVAKIDIGDIVILKTDNERRNRICTGLSIRKGTISYNLACGSAESWHYDFEFEHEAKRVKIGFK